MPSAGSNDYCSEVHVFHSSAACHGANRRAHYQVALVVVVVYRQERAHTFPPTFDFCSACSSHHVAQVASSWLHCELPEVIGLMSLRSLSIAISEVVTS